VPGIDPRDRVRVEVRGMKLDATEGRPAVKRFGPVKHKPKRHKRKGHR